MCKQVVVSEYMKMHQFLKEEQQLQLLDKEEKQRENEIHLTQQVSRLSKTIGRMESTCPNLTLESFEVRRNSGGCQEKLTEKICIVTSSISIQRNYIFRYSSEKLSAA